MTEQYQLKTKFPEKLNVGIQPTNHKYNTYAAREHGIPVGCAYHEGKFIVAEYQLVRVKQMWQETVESDYTPVEK